jgi:hypothetical protein
MGRERWKEWVMSAPGTEAPSERLALVSLALASLPNSQEVQAAFERSYPAFRTLPVPVAVDVLAATLGSPTPPLPRVVAADALFRLAVRTKRLASIPQGSPLSESLGRLAGAIATAPKDAISTAQRAAEAEARRQRIDLAALDRNKGTQPAQSGEVPGNAPPVQPAVARERPQLAEASVARRGAQPAQSDVLAESAMPAQPDLEVMVHAGEGLVTVLQDISGGPDIQSALDLEAAWQKLAVALQFSQKETQRPFCDCSQTLIEEGYDAQGVVVDFRTGVPVAAMKRYADPNNWPNCSTFFRAMDQQGARQPKGGPNWDATFEEIIDVVPGLTLFNPLRFEYRETPDGSFVRSDYKLVVPTEHILVDEGFIEVREDTTTSPAGSAVTVVKVIRFVDPEIQTWPSFACDLFWGDLSLDMAMQCSSGV